MHIMNIYLKNRNFRMNLDSTINLKEMRLQANISQMDMANKLGVSQSQVSRYEDEPEDVSLRMIKKWAEVCGFLESNVSGLELGEPYANIKEKIDKLDRALQYVPKSETFNDLDVTALVQSLKMKGRKPRVGVFGHFDMGKSRLCNTLLGGAYLPTGYQPMTDVACIVRHIEDKPIWQSEDVWMLSEGFDIHKIDDEAHCKAHKTLAGGIESLNRYATRNDAKDEVSHFAVIYIDVPLLKACDLVDMPGYGNDQNDAHRTELATSFVDIVLYLSAVQGFLGKNDLDYIGGLVNVLPNFEDNTLNLRPLDNLYIIATRADQIKESKELSTIFDKAAKRAYQHLELRFAEKESKNPISEDYFKTRFFSFTADKRILRQDFERDFTQLLGQILARKITTEFEASVQKMLSLVTQDYLEKACNLEKILENQEQSKADFEKIKQDQPERIAKRLAKVANIAKEIERFKYLCLNQANTIFEQKMQPDAVENMIKAHYQDKKDAQQLAVSYLADSIQTEINKSTKERSVEFSHLVNEYLQDFEIKQENTYSIKTGFDANTAFMGVMAGLGTFGALSVWATVAAAGSNLGAYLLIPTVVSFLSSLGISVGGTSAAISFVAAIGGPITLGIGLAVLTGVAVMAIFGKSWQKKLAEKIIESLQEQQYQSQVLQGITQYWEDTWNGFQQASIQMETEYQQRLQVLQQMVEQTDRKKIQQEKTFYEAVSYFIENLKI